MFTEKVYTLEEVAEHFKVPLDAISNEVASGHLRAKNIAGHWRVLESDLNAYKGIDAPGQSGSAVTYPNTAVELAGAEDFRHKWPDGKDEAFSDAMEGTASYAGKKYHVKVGFTLRPSGGKTRRRSLVLVDRYPTVEFVSGGTEKHGMMASIIRDRSGKQVLVRAGLPPEYSHLNVGPYQDVVVGRGTSNGLAVICRADDVNTMVRHALIRYRFREERK